MDNSKVIAYYKDQIAFYKKRAKRAEKNIKEQEQFVKMGMGEIDPMYQVVFETETELVNLFESKLKQVEEK